MSSTLRKPSISEREWIKWESEAHVSEPTSTLVLTSPENRFVDIRLLLAEPQEGVPEVARLGAIRSFAQLDWAFAGFSSSEIIKDPKDGKMDVTQSTWRHFVDSRHLNSEGVSDSGIMTPLANGMTLETGSMVNPATGKMEKYEEMWRDGIPDLRKDGGLECAVLQLQDDDQKVRGMVVRLAQWCQGVIRENEKFALERWVLTEAKGWQRVVRMGDLWMPCGVAMEMDKLVPGGKVKFGQDEWHVVELRVDGLPQRLVGIQQ